MGLERRSIFQLNLLRAEVKGTLFGCLVDSHEIRSITLKRHRVIKTLLVAITDSRCYTLGTSNWRNLLFKKLSNSWELTKESFNVLMLDKELMVFPVISAVATVTLLASFFVPAAMLIDPETMADESSAVNSLIAFGGLFMFYFIGTYVMMFCNTALLYCAKIRFEGGDPTISDGLAAGWKNKTKILYWAAISGTIGVVLAQLEQKLGFLGSIIRKLAGGAWVIITYFAVPVLIFEDVAPGEAISRSKTVVQKMWGEAAIAHLGMGAVQQLVGLGGFLIMLASIPLAIKMESVEIFLIGLALGVIILVTTTIVFSCLAQIYRAALYIYATTNEPPRAFRRELLDGAFH